VLPEPWPSRFYDDSAPFRPGDLARIANATARVQAFRDVDTIHNRARGDDRPLAAETSVIYEALVTRVIISMGTHSFDPVLVGLQSLRQQG